MNLLPAVLRRGSEVDRSMQTPLPFDGFLDLVTQFSFNGVQYTQPSVSQEQIAPMFTAFSRLAYKQNSVVFACMAARQMLLSEARFCFRERRNGRPGNLFTTADLGPLEEPWPGATTGDLISRMELYASLGGNWFGVAVNGGIRSLRPDWVKILVGSETDGEAVVWDADAVVVGYGYQPGGPGSGRDPVIYPAEQVAHYAPYPDPEAQFRGMSWLTPVIREVMADKAATDHKLAFFENGATPNLVVKMEVDDLQKWVQAIRQFSADHDGVRNAYKTMYLGAGMDATVVGADFQQMDFKVTQGAGETRIAAAARVPAVVAQISEGLQGSSLNAGNFESSMRMMADMMARPAWRNMAGSLARIVPPPNSSSELWYDDRDIPALKEDLRKAGERQQADATAINTLVTAGCTLESTIDAVTSGDFNRLVDSGLRSVQLLPPGQGDPATPPPTPTPAPGNGKRSEDMQEVLAQIRRERLELDAARPIEIHNHVPALEPAPINVTFDAPPPAQITVEAAQAPDVNVTVEPTRVDFAPGAIHVDAPVTVEPSHVTVEAARQPDVNVTVEPSHFTVEPSQITVEAAPTPDVHVTVEPTQIGEGAVQVTVEPTTVTVDAAPVPEVHIHPPVQRPRAAKVKRDGDGTLNVTYEAEEEPSDD